MRILYTDNFKKVFDPIELSGVNTTYYKLNEGIEITYAFINGARVDTGEPNISILHAGRIVRLYPDIFSEGLYIDLLPYDHQLIVLDCDLYKNNKAELKIWFM